MSALRLPSALALAALSLLACTLDQNGTAPSEGAGAGTTTSTAPSVGGGGAGPTGGGGGAGATGDGGSGATGGVGGFGGGAEDCTNGTDDDGDGLLDCEEPQCAAAFTCVPEAGSPVFVATGVTCAAPFDTLSLFDCAACQCDANPGVCQMVGDLWSNPACTQYISGSHFDTTSCINTDAADGSGIHVTATVNLNVQGSCAPAAPDPPLAACQLEASAVCAAGGQVCALNNVAPACVLVDGGACPVGYPSARSARTPGAGGCGCGCAKSGEACPTEIKVFGNDNCPGAGTTVNVGGSPQCTNTGLNAIDSIAPPTPTLTCTASSAPTGPARTLCCAAR